MIQAHKELAHFGKRYLAKCTGCLSGTLDIWQTSCKIVGLEQATTNVVLSFGMVAACTSCTSHPSIKGWIVPFANCVL